MMSTILTAIASMVTGAGGILLFFPQVRKSKIIENEAKQSAEWKKLYDEERILNNEERKEWEADRARMGSKIDTLYDVITKHRDEKAEIIKQNTMLEVEITRLRMLKCEAVNCPKRQPPTGY